MALGWDLSRCENFIDCESPAKKVYNFQQPLPRWHGQQKQYLKGICGPEAARKLWGSFVSSWFYNHFVKTILHRLRHSRWPALLLIPFQPPLLHYSIKNSSRVSESFYAETFIVTTFWNCQQAQEQLERYGSLFTQAHQISTATLQKKINQLKTHKAINSNRNVTATNLCVNALLRGKKWKWTFKRGKKVK